MTTLTPPSHPSAPPKPPGAGLAALYRRHSLTVLRVSVGILFLWFGALKLIPGTSAAEDLATRTMSALTFHHVPADVSRPLLGMMEILIGTGLVTGLLLRLTLAVFLVHMSGTFLTLVVLADEMWAGPAACPTLAGQYVIKNIVLLTAGLAIAAHAWSTPPGPDEEPPGSGRADPTGV
ncbi:DoxX family membrane protein [Streptomyces sodiiphilus]